MKLIACQWFALSKHYWFGRPNNSELSLFLMYISDSMIQSLQVDEHVKRKTIDGELMLKEILYVLRARLLEP